jgi:hypothetical protein
MYPKHCCHDAIEPLLAHYANRTAKTAKGIPPAVATHCNGALLWKEGTERDEDPRDTVFAGPTSGVVKFQQEKDGDTDVLKSYFKVIHGDMTKLTSAGLVPKFKYRFVVLDVWYEFHPPEDKNHPQPMDAKTFGNVLDQVLSMSTSPLVTIVVFMSHLQKVGFEAEMRRVCNAGVELAYWSKVQVNNLPGNRLTNIIEEMLIGYHNNTPSAPATYRVADFFRQQQGVPRTNVFESYKVMRFFKKATGDRGALNEYQKPMVLFENIFHHLNGGVGDTLLDLGCGSASACGAALNLGMNCIGMDSDKLQTRGAFERLKNLDTLPDGDQERNVVRGRFQTATEKKKTAKKARKASDREDMMSDSSDEESGEEDGDTDDETIIIDDMTDSQKAIRVRDCPIPRPVLRQAVFNKDGSVAGDDGEFPTGDASGGAISAGDPVSVAVTATVTAVDAQEVGDGEPQQEKGAGDCDNTPLAVDGAVGAGANTPTNSTRPVNPEAPENVSAGGEGEQEAGTPEGAGKGKKRAASPAAAIPPAGGEGEQEAGTLGGAGKGKKRAASPAADIPPPASPATKRGRGTASGARGGGGGRGAAGTRRQWP